MSLASIPANAVQDTPEPELGGDVGNDVATPEQQVDMMRSEMELYLRDRRPTGKLLASVAALKGLSAESIARAARLPEGIVSEILGDLNVTGMSLTALRRVADVLGIDLTNMRLSTGCVHVFDVRQLSTRKAKDCQVMLRGLGLLARGAVAARISVRRSLHERLRGLDYIILQHDDFRALVIGSRHHKLDLNVVPGARWARANEEAHSVIEVPDGELADRLRALDITTAEFDELIEGASALTWQDVIVSSRVNAVSKQMLMQFIRECGTQAEESEMAAQRAEIASPRPVLKLVAASEPQGLSNWPINRRVVAGGN